MEEERTRMTASEGKAGEATQGARSKSPVLWARWGSISRAIAQGLKARGPAVLILSLPRSGSSWIGETLGRAINALYLREPVTQGDRAFYYKGTVFSPEEPDVAESYRTLADKAFMGWPDFGRHIVVFPPQWGLVWRRPRRVVIKEVNPLACQWYLRRYEPRVVLLVRHPVGVALSWHKKGWLGMEPEAWARNGQLQGRALRFALEALAEYPAYQNVIYEQVCADPMGEFERMFAFAGLTWNGMSRAYVRRTSRDSSKMIDAWRGKVSAEAVEAMREAYRQFDLPWYQKDEEW